MRQPPAGATHTRPQVWGGNGVTDTALSLPRTESCKSVERNVDGAHKGRRREDQCLLDPSPADTPLEYNPYCFTNYMNTTYSLGARQASSRSAGSSLLCWRQLDRY